MSKNFNISENDISRNQFPSNCNVLLLEKIKALCFPLKSLHDHHRCRSQLN